MLGPAASPPAERDGRNAAAPRERREAGAATDDYLKSIYSHTEWQDEPITPSQLADTLGVAPSSVTEMVKKLAARDLVDHQPYRAVRLTEAGARHALQVLRRHRLIETWLVRVMGYGWHEVHDEAEVLEHAVSDRLLAAIDAQLGHPVADPHGDAIPAEDGAVRRVPHRLLLDCPAGYRGTVLRVSDRDPSLLTELDAAGVQPGATLLLQDHRDDVLLVATAGDPVPVSAAAAAVVWVSA